MKIQADFLKQIPEATDIRVEPAGNHAHVITDIGEFVVINGILMCNREGII